MMLKQNALSQIICYCINQNMSSLPENKQASGVGTADAKTQMNHLSLSRPLWLLHHLVMESKRDKQYEDMNLFCSTHLSQTATCVK